MFTGIIESVGIVREIIPQGSNLNFRIESAISKELKPDQSVAHNGVCLTVVEITENRHYVTAVAETLSKTNLGNWKINDLVNLERSLKIGDRLDGHFVQGHVDTTGVCTSRKNLEGSWIFRFRFPEAFAGLIIEKGSICINGVSLTVFDVSENSFSVTIIPFTYEHTSFNRLKENDPVNLEFDVLGKYLLRKEALRKRIED